jgi:Fic family protein
MQAHRRLATFEEALVRERSSLRSLEGAPARELDRLYLEEIAASTALAGAKLSLPEVEALVARGVVLGPQSLEDCLLVADYADAVRFLREVPLPAGRRPYLRLEEIVGLHGRALCRSAAGEPGTWRAINVGPLSGGMMPPGPALVPRQMLALVDRCAAGPPAGSSRLLWVVELHRRFTRIHPFRRGTGRTGRLLVSLLLRRLDLPPFALRGNAAERYLTALNQAGSPEPSALASILARALLASETRLNHAASGSADLRPLASLAESAGKEALYKAAQRGRLRVVRRQGALFTTEAWIAEYRTSRRSR